MNNLLTTDYLKNNHVSRAEKRLVIQYKTMSDYYVSCLNGIPNIEEAYNAALFTFCGKSTTNNQKLRLLVEILKLQLHYRGLNKIIEQTLIQIQSLLDKHIPLDNLKIEKEKLQSAYKKRRDSAKCVAFLSLKFAIEIMQGHFDQFDFYMFCYGPLFPIPPRKEYLDKLKEIGNIFD